LVQRQLVSDVSQAYLNLLTARQKLTTATAEQTNAEEALRLAQGRYKAGVGVFLDVLDAENALVAANTNRVNARNGVDQAIVQLAHAIGTNVPDQTGLPR
jgi:outer membrane protein TolC